MHAPARTQAFVAIIVAVCFVGAPFLHNVIPHDHGAEDTCDAIYGHGHCPPGQNETGLWQFIHNALAHEEKKTVAPAGQRFVLMALAVLLAMSLSRFVRIERLAPDRYERALSEGRLRFRAFG